MTSFEKFIIAGNVLGLVCYLISNVDLEKYLTKEKFRHLKFKIIKMLDSDATTTVLFSKPDKIWIDSIGLRTTEDKFRKVIYVCKYNGIGVNGADSITGYNYTLRVSEGYYHDFCWYFGLKHDKNSENIKKIYGGLMLLSEDNVENVSVVISL